jgi:hypothetical protein
MVQHQECMAQHQQRMAQHQAQHQQRVLLLIIAACVSMPRNKNGELAVASKARLFTANYIRLHVGGRCSFSGRITNIGVLKGKKGKCLRVQAVDKNGDDISICGFNELTNTMFKYLSLGAAFTATDLVVKAVEEKFRITELETELAFCNETEVRPLSDAAIPMHASLQHNGFNTLAMLPDGTKVDHVFKFICPTSSSQAALHTYFTKNQLPSALQFYGADETNHMALISVSKHAGEKNIRIMANILKADYNNRQDKTRAKPIIFLRRAKVSKYNNVPTIFAADWTSIALVDPDVTELASHQWSNLQATFLLRGTPSLIQDMLSKYN